jgi:ribosomal 50S subunit-recycling heat shock protein
MFGYMKLIAIVAVIGAIGAAYAYHKVTVAELTVTVAQLEANNRTLKQNNDTLQVAAENNAAKVLELEAQKQEEQVQVAALTTRNNQLEEDRKNYMKIFKDHNLTRLSRAKPGLIENRINSATAEVFKQVEDNSKEIQDADNM